MSESDVGKAAAEFVEGLEASAEGPGAGAAGDYDAFPSEPHEDIDESDGRGKEKDPRTPEEIEADRLAKAAAEAAAAERAEAALNTERQYVQLTLTPKNEAATNILEQDAHHVENEIEMVDMGNNAVAEIQNQYDAPPAQPGAVATPPIQQQHQIAQGVNNAALVPANQHIGQQQADALRAANGWSTKTKVKVIVAGVSLLSVGAIGGFLGALFLPDDDEDPEKDPHKDPDTDPTVDPDAANTLICGFTPGTSLQDYVDASVQAWRAMPEDKTWCVITAWATATTINGEPITGLTPPTTDAQQGTIVALAILARGPGVPPDGLGLPDDVNTGQQAWHDAYKLHQKTALVNRKESAGSGKPLAWDGETDTKTMLELYRDVATLMDTTGVDEKPLHRAYKLAVLAQTLGDWEHPGAPG